MIIVYITDQRQLPQRRHITIAHTHNLQVVRSSFVNQSFSSFSKSEDTNYVYNDSITATRAESVHTVYRNRAYALHTQYIYTHI